jgi:hypothetical protein
MSGRPDPITPRTLGWTTMLAVAGAIVSAAIDTGWKLPATNNLMDWVRSILILLGAAAGVYIGAQKAKQHTTPLSSPKSADGYDLVPVGRHEALEPDDGSRFLDEWADDTDPPPRPPITD